MKKYALLLIVITVFGVLPMYSQTTNAFRINYDQALFDLPGNATESLTANQYVFAGTNLNFFPIYGTVTELDAVGDLVWSKRYYDGSFGFQINDIKKDNAANEYYVCGGSESNAGVFMRLDAAGNVIVSTKFEINEADGAYLNRIIKASDGGYVAVGYVTGHDPDGAGPETYFGPINYTDADGDPQTEIIGSPLIVKFDASGNHQWHHITRYYTTIAANPADRIYNDASFSDVVEVGDGFIAVGQYDVNQHLSNTNSDGDDATATDAVIFKTDLSGAILYHRQIDNPDTSPTQSSNYLSAINKTSVGDPIAAGGTGGGRELIQKYGALGGFSLTFSRRFTYSSFFIGVDPVDISQVYEVNGGTDIVTMGMYIKPFSFIFSNSLHRYNGTATSTTWAKYFTFGLATILPRGQQTSDNGFIMASTTLGASFDYQVIKTDPNGDTPLTDCAAISFTPAASAGPTTMGSPNQSVWSGTPQPNGLAILVTNITPIQNVICLTTSCTPPPLADNVTATPNPICAGESTTINATGPGVGVSYNVYTAATGGTNLGGVPLVVSPGTTTTYYIETVNDADPTCVSTSRVAIEVVVNAPVTPTFNQVAPICIGDAFTLPTTSTNGYTGSWAPAINNTVTTEYTFTPDGGQCATTTTMTVVISDGPSLTISGNDISCFGANDGDAEVVATGDGPFNYSWSPAGGTSANASNLVANSYTVTVTDNNGCSNTANITIDGPAELTLTTSSTASSCTVNDGSASVVALGGTPGYTYSWSSGGTSDVESGIGAGIYTITVTDANGCAAQENVTVGSVNGPTLTLLSSENISCFGGNDGSAAVEATGGTPGYSYSWSPSGGAAASATGLGAGTYTATVTDDAGCSASVQVEITEPDALLISGNATDANCGLNDGTITVNASGGSGSYTYTWTPNVGNTAAVSGLTGGSYSVVVEDANGCSASTSFNVGVSGSIPIDVIPDFTTIDAGDNVDLEVIIGGGITGANITWSPSTGLSCTNCPNPNASPSETTTYYVTVTAADGCFASDSVTVYVNIPCNDLFVPNIFSPNNDGNNDFLCIYGGCIESLEFAIYSRWGQKVFETTDPNECWDGTYKDKPINSETFVYKMVIKLAGESEQILESGNINLVR